jgi:cobalt-zinc-cadmium efflux system outer membrane protein
LSHDILPEVEVVYDAALTGFRHGKFGILDVLDAQRTLLDARARRVQAVAAAHLAATDLQRLFGGIAGTAEPDASRLPETP